MVNNRKVPGSIPGTCIFTGTEKLTIFGAQRSRRGALLKVCLLLTIPFPLRYRPQVMSSVETKNPGWFTDGCTEKRHKDVKGFATDRWAFGLDIGNM